jgi:hypothetical protein
MLSVYDKTKDQCNIKNKNNKNTIVCSTDKKLSYEV